MKKTITIPDLKKKYVTYFEDVPIQKYAAMAVGRDEDTIVRWKKEDQDFADAVQMAKAEWVRKKVIATKAEFALERLEREVFSKNASETISNLTLKTVDYSKMQPAAREDAIIRVARHLINKRTTDEEL